MKIFFIVFISFIAIQGYRLVSLRRQVEQNKVFWQKQTQATPAKDALWYVALGDSAGQGIGASAPQNGYVGLVADALYKKTNRPIHVVNLSVSGARIADAESLQLAQLEEITLPIDVVISLEIGANDMSNFEPKRFEHQLDSLLGKLPEKTVVSDVPYFGKGIFRSREKSVVQANEIVHKLVAKYKLRLVPLHEVTMANSSWLNNAADMFHPNDRGYRGWYKAFWEILGAK